MTEITVNRLSRNQIEQMATRVAGGKMLPTEIVQQLVDKTDGVPLYVEEMTKAVLESGVLKETNGQYALSGSLSTLSIPATLHDSLMARLDRLVTAKGIAQIGATIGRQFSYELLQAVSQVDEGTLQRELGRLVEAELVYQRGLPPQATYFFKHALIQDTAYESLLRSTRQGYHRRIAEVLEERFPKLTEFQPELLGYHYTEAGLNELSIDYWHKAGVLATERSAHHEAITYLQRGLDLLCIYPETKERALQELVLLRDLSTSVGTIQGYAAPEREAICVRVLDLCQQVGDRQQLFYALHGFWGLYVNRGDIHASVDLTKQLLNLTEHVCRPEDLFVAYWAHGTTLILQGQFPSGCSYLEKALLHTDHERGDSTFRRIQDPKVACLSWISLERWLLGYPVQALQQSIEALNRAHELDHPFSLSFALWGTTMLRQMRRDRQEVQQQAEDLIAYTIEQGLPYFRAIGTVLRGWILAVQGDYQDGIDQQCQGLIDFKVTGAGLFLTSFLALLAESYENMGETEEGLSTIAEAMSLVEKNGEHWYESELHRLKGQLLLQQSSSNATEVEPCFHQAISTARSQQAKSWELRSTTSLARLWQSQGKRDEAREMLEPVYSWFTEGFDTADLIDAKALLDELA